MRSKSLIRSAIAVACLPAFGTLAYSSESVRYDLQIERQSLSSALQEFARQSGVQIIFFSKVTDGHEAPPLSGKFTAAAALGALLNESQLTFRELNPNTIEVKPKAAVNDLKTAVPHASAEASASRFADESGAGVAGAGAIRLAQTDERSRSGASDGENSLENPTLKELDLTAIPEMLVIGSRTFNADIERTEDAPQPYVVFDREQIERSMATNAEDFLKSRLPMNTLQRTGNQSPGGFNNTSTINLRGLGANQTLILVNGRRMPSVNFEGSFGQPDINGLPLAAIERIEVLPSTASGIYGGGATGGVVNIITRQDYSGLDLNVTYGNSFDSDVASRRIDASAGFELEDGRTNIMLTASHADSNPLLTGERDFAARGRALQFANNPSVLLTGFSPPLGYTSNICSASAPFPGVNFSNCNSAPLVLDNGTPLNSSRTFVPVGYAGPASDGGAALVANAGQYNVAVPDDLNGNRISLLGNPTVDSAALDVRRRFGDSFEAFLGASWYDNQGEFSAAQLPFDATLQANAPNNPFTTAIKVRFPGTSLASPLDSKSETFRALGGMIVRLPRDWTAALDYSWSRSRYSYFVASPLVGDPDGPLGAAPSVDTALVSGALNVVRDLNAFPLDYSPYLLQQPNFFLDPGETRLRDATLRLSGPVFQLPGGPLTVSALVERRKEEALDTFQTRIDPFGIFASGQQIFFTPGRSQTVDSYYLETRAPLIAQAMHVPGVRALELQASVRRDEYETVSAQTNVFIGGSREGPFIIPPAFVPQPLPASLPRNTNSVEATKYTLGLRYSPVEDLVLRASRGTGFLPPSIHQIVNSNPPFMSGLSLTDPKRGDVPGFVFATIAQGGNPNLVPENSESWSAGLIFTPRFWPNFRLSADYTRIEKTAEIAVLATQEVLNLEDSLAAGRVVRAALTAGDIALGYTGGAITAIDTTLINVAVTQVEAYDVQADYTWQTDRMGSFHFFAVATWQPHFERKGVPAAAFVDIAGFDQGPLEWRGNAGLSWQRGSWTVDWNTQYYDSYFAYTATASPNARAATTLSQGSATIPSQMYHDIFARYRFDGPESWMYGLLADTEITLGIQNVLNEIPPILAIAGTSGGYSAYGDPRLRRYSISVRKRF